jgi:hypothetical protein
MRWTASQLLRPIVFVLAIVAAVLVGNDTDSVWYGLLTFFIAMSAGRVLRSLVRGDLPQALYRAIWPGAATGFAFLYDALGVPSWATFFVAWISASLTKHALRPVMTRQRTVIVRGNWRNIDLDELLP